MLDTTLGTKQEEPKAGGNVKPEISAPITSSTIATPEVEAAELGEAALDGPDAA